MLHCVHKNATLIASPLDVDVSMASSSRHEVGGGMHATVHVCRQITLLLFWVRKANCQVMFHVCNTYTCACKTVVINIQENEQYMMYYL